MSGESTSRKQSPNKYGAYFTRHFGREMVDFSVKGPVAVSLDEEQVTSPGCCVIDLLFSSPSQVGELVFRNYYTAWLTVLVKSEHGYNLKFAQAGSPSEQAEMNEPLAIKEDAKNKLNEMWSSLCEEQAAIHREIELKHSNAKDVKHRSNAVGNKNLEKKGRLVERRSSGSSSKSIDIEIQPGNLDRKARVNKAPISLEAQSVAQSQSSTGTNNGSSSVNQSVFGSGSSCGKDRLVVCSKTGAQIPRGKVHNQTTTAAQGTNTLNAEPNNLNYPGDDLPTQTPTVQNHSNTCETKKTKACFPEGMPVYRGRCDLSDYLKIMFGLKKKIDKFRRLKDTLSRRFCDCNNKICRYSTVCTCRCTCKYNCSCTSRYTGKYNYSCTSNVHGRTDGLNAEYSEWVPYSESQKKIHKREKKTKRKTRRCTFYDDDFTYNIGTGPGLVAGMRVNANPLRPLTNRHCVGTGCAPKANCRTYKEVGGWVVAVRQRILMPNPHQEIGSHELISIPATESIVEWQELLGIRLILRQPSPAWRSFHVEEISVFRDMPRCVPRHISTAPPVRPCDARMALLEYRTVASLHWAPIIDQPEPTSTEENSESLVIIWLLLAGEPQ